MPNRPVALDTDDSARPRAKLYLPKNAGKDARPLVILLHGYSSTADRANDYFKLHREVNKRNCMLLVPQGHTDSRGYPFWNATDFCCDLDRTKPNDVKYILDLIAEVRSKYPTDANRIYLVGHSNGGFMANRLVCEAPGLFTGVASLAGGNFKNPADCAHPSSISYLQIHGVDDPTIAFTNVPNYAGGEETLQRRSEVNGCDLPPRETAALDLVVPLAGDDTQVIDWPGCRNNVQLWKIGPYIGKPGAPHKPAFTEVFAPLLLDWLLKQTRAI